MQIFTIFADRPASAKIKTAKRWKLMMSLRAYVEYRCEHDGSLQSVCPLNGCCKEESASYCTKYQQNRKRRSEDVTSTGRGVVRAFRKNKTVKISSEEPGRFSAKICTSENFPLYSISLWKILTTLLYLLTLDTPTHSLYLLTLDTPTHSLPSSYLYSHTLHSHTLLLHTLPPPQT